MLSSLVLHPNSNPPGQPTLQRQNAENLKQIFPEKEFRGLHPNFHIHVSESELYIPMMGLPFLTVAPMRGIYLHLKQRYRARNILH